MQYVGKPGKNLSAVDAAFWCLIALMMFFIIFTVIKDSKRPAISVSGKTLSFDGVSLTSYEISRVKCTKLLERIEVYSDGRKVLVFP